MIDLVMKRNFARLLHVYHSRFIPEGVAGTSQIFLRNRFYQKKDLARLRDANVLPK
jgi:hypothetical protein